MKLKDLILKDLLLLHKKRVQYPFTIADIANKYGVTHNYVMQLSKNEFSTRYGEEFKTFSKRGGKRRTSFKKKQNV